MPTVFTPMKPAEALEDLAARRITRLSLETLQVNLGRRCNQACRHCHVDAAPWRTEMMSAEVAGRVANWIREHRPPVVDLTGGAPELSEHFRGLVETARGVGCRVIDRNNLTIIETEAFSWLPDYLARHGVEVIASLPCYLQDNVDAQRGDGVFEKSLRALRKLNAAGYGHVLSLSLVFNPQGAKLPPDQVELEAEYRDELRRRYGIEFSRLLTLTNQPIARFAEDLRATGRYESYLELLANSYNPSTVDGLMCRTTLSVGLEGEVYDCDFHQMLGMRLGGVAPRHLWDLVPDELPGRPIHLATHCLACTAGCGSSCGGALVGAVAMTSGPGANES
jgi:radical SAM/Cys-rich protein